MYRFKHKPSNIQFINTKLINNTLYLKKGVKLLTDKLKIKSKYTYLITNNPEKYKNKTDYSLTLNRTKITVIDKKDIENLEKYKYLLGEDDTITLILDEDISSKDRNTFFTKLPMTFVLVINLINEETYDVL